MPMTQARETPPGVKDSQTNEAMFTRNPQTTTSVRVMDLFIPLLNFFIWFVVGVDAERFLFASMNFAAPWRNAPIAPISAANAIAMAIQVFIIVRLLKSNRRNKESAATYISKADASPAGNVDGPRYLHPWRYEFLCFRDGERCALCKSVSIRLWVNHIDGQRGNNQQENLRLLCRHCLVAESRFKND